MSWTNEVISRIEPGALAVFDADGTLWAGDVGEGLQAAFIADGTFSHAVEKKYQALMRTDFATAYIYGTQALAGLREEWLVERAERFFAQEWEAQIFPEMRALVAGLLDKGVNVHIASASNRWIVERGAARLGIPAERVHAMTVAVKDGVITEELVPPAVTRDGKATLIREKLGGSPALVAGNSVNDLPMLRLATHVALAVNAESGADPKSGEDLAAEAAAKGWLMRTVTVG